MEIIKTYEEMPFDEEMEWEEIMALLRTRIILREGSQYYYAIAKGRYQNDSDIVVKDLDLVPIIESRMWPHYQKRFKIATTPIPENYYIKSPNLVYYGEGDAVKGMGECTLQEVEVYEVLEKSPHPNIARYFGCVVTEDKISAICIAKYDVTLEEFMKQNPSFDRKECCRQIEDGVQHLHRLGFVHGDLNPNNIMMSGRVPIIIDFDSCCRTGQELGPKSGTPGWQDGNPEIAETKDDDIVLKKLLEYIMSFGVVEST